MSRTCHRKCLDSFEVCLKSANRVEQWVTINDIVYRGVLFKSLRVRFKSRTDSDEYFLESLLSFFCK